MAWATFLSDNFNRSNRTLGSGTDNYYYQAIGSTPGTAGAAGIYANHFSGYYYVANWAMGLSYYNDGAADPGADCRATVTVTRNAACWGGVILRGQGGTLFDQCYTSYHNFGAATNNLYSKDVGGVGTTLLGSYSSPVFATGNKTRITCEGNSITLATDTGGTMTDRVGPVANSQHPAAGKPAMWLQNYNNSSTNYMDDLLIEESLPSTGIAPHMNHLRRMSGGY